MSRVINGLALALFVAAAAVGCSKRISGDKTEDAVKAVIGKDVEVPIKTVTCPDGGKPRKGDISECVVTFEGGGSLRVKVEQVDDEGTATFTPATQFFYGDKLAANIVGEAKAKGTVVTADCGDKIHAFDPPGAIQCTATQADGKVVRLNVKFDANLATTTEVLP
jgi:hypothetical protein